MTRFARSKGSKSSNERIPEQSTPWGMMVQQLKDKQSTADQSLQKAEFEAKRKENYQNFLKEQKEMEIKKTWCDFDSDKIKSEPEAKLQNDAIKISKNKRKKEKKNLADGNSTSPNKTLPVKKSKPQKKQESDDESVIDEDDPELSKWCDEYSDKETDEKFVALTSQLEEICKKEENKQSKKNKKLNVNKIEVDEDQMENKRQKKKPKFEETVVSENLSEINQEKKKEKLKGDEIVVDENPTENKKKQKKNRKRKTEENMNEPHDIGVDVEKQSNSDIPMSSKNIKKAKKSKNNLNADQLIKNTEVDQDDNLIVEDAQSNNTQVKKKKKRNKKPKTANVDDTIHGNSKPEAAIVNKKDNLNMPNKNPFNVKEYKRRKPVVSETSIIIVNGETLEVTNYDGFPILSKEVERLQQLRKSLISRGIPRSEVDRTMKLERRKAEKALARMKKKLCFHCRKGGHNLSECPELNKEGGGGSGIPSSGLCFKCGSTEHTHFACKVVKTQDYKFAQCFICKEQGHITRQCPDNPRGLYPKGGGCRECGDVTHLKKDCPKVMQKREDESYKLETMETNNVEDIENTAKPSSVRKSSVKHVHF